MTEIRPDPDLQATVSALVIDVLSLVCAVFPWACTPQWRLVTDVRSAACQRNAGGTSLKQVHGSRCQLPMARLLSLLVKLQGPELVTTDVPRL